jgi:hypothetical protein
MATVVSREDTGALVETSDEKGSDMSKKYVYLAPTTISPSRVEKGVMHWHLLASSTFSPGRVVVSVSQSTTHARMAREETEQIEAGRGQRRTGLQRDVVLVLLHLFSVQSADAHLLELLQAQDHLCRNEDVSASKQRLWCVVRREGKRPYWG